MAVLLLIPVLRLTRPHWALAALMAGTAIVFVAGVGMQYGAHELRYVVGPQLMLFAALAALMLPRSQGPRWLAWTPMVVLFVGVALVFATSYRTQGQRAYALAAWDEAVVTARAACQTPDAEFVFIDPATGTSKLILKGQPLEGPPGWPVQVPCDRLR
jgi:hypothetical protein